MAGISAALGAELLACPTDDRGLTVRAQAARSIMRAGGAPTDDLRLSLLAAVVWPSPSLLERTRELDKFEESEGPLELELVRALGWKVAVRTCGADRDGVDIKARRNGDVVRKAGRSVEIVAPLLLESVLRQERAGVP
jgi:hypothetical protein